MATWLLIPLLGHFLLVLALYVALTVLRTNAVRAGRNGFDAYLRADGDKGAALRVQRCLTNQFEAPLFVYFAALVLLHAGAVTAWDVAAAWIFFAGRLIHAAVQTMTENVPLRGAVFSINFLGVLMLMGHVGWLVLAGGLK